MRILNYIDCPELKEYCKILLKEVPPYFFTVPTGTSGVHYPDSSLVKGGLLVQVETSMKIAIDLYKSGIFTLTERELDLALTALMFKDTFRYGKREGRSADPKHPHLAADFVQNHKMTGLYLRDKEAHMVVSAIRSHMGNDNKNRSGEEISPAPKTAFQKFVHICDYMATRSYLDTNLEKLKIS